MARKKASRRLKAKIMKEELAMKGAKDPGALASYIGSKKYGRGRMAKMAAKGQRGR